MCRNGFVKERNAFRPILKSWKNKGFSHERRVTLLDLGDMALLSVGLPVCPVSQGHFGRETPFHPELKGIFLSESSGGTLLAGAACMDITPAQDGLWLAGHARLRKASGIRDPLCVRTLYLSDGETALSFSCLDLVGLRKIHVDQIRKRASGTLPAEGILIFTTHTHDAPDTIGYWGKRLFNVLPVQTGIDPDYMEKVQSQTAASIQAARQQAVPVKVFAACAEAPEDLTRNVRREGFKEDRVFMLRFCDEQDHTVAVLSNYPCHPEMLGHDNLEVSAEFLTDLHRTVEEALGGVSVFLQQALGGMVTGGVSLNDGSFDRSSGEPFIPHLGESLGKLIVGALEDGSESVAPDGRIRFVRREFLVPLKNRKLLLAARMGIIPAQPEELKTRRLLTETSFVEFGPVRMATVPGEALPELGFQIQAILNCPYPFVLCMGCDELGYILPRRYQKDRNYRYENSMSVGPDLSDLLLEEIRWMAWKGERKMQSGMD